MEDKYQKEDEIDLMELVQTVWQGRKTIVKFLIIFGIIGLFVAIFSETEYTASTTVIPQTSEGNKMGGSLGGLAAMAGINLGGGGSSNGISPKLYPKITASVPFKRAVINAPLQIDGVSKKVTFKEYYEEYYSPSLLSYIKKYTIGLPGVLIGAIRGGGDEEKVIVENDGIYRISGKEKRLFGVIKNQLSVNVNDKEGFVQISFSMPEALASAQMVKYVQGLLQESITKFKIEKLKSDYQFIEQSYNDAKEEFIKKQSILASFKDRNQGLVFSRSQSKLRRLESEYNLSFNLYSELAKQLESQKIKLKENTPIFTVLESVSVPTEKSKPKRAMILIIWLFLGGVIGVGVIFGKQFLGNLKVK
ncbi:MAG: capsule biosynthesis protein [Flavobacteriaceae bacterium]|nr:capsule biosynthesis protein [Flavobacteriaceae bacterium]